MLTSILHYSTIDFRFLELNLMQLSKFSDEIIIPICDHLFSGHIEDENLMKKSIDIINKFSNAKYHIFKWQGYHNNTWYYHNLSRQIGTNLSSHEWLLFVDTDEFLDDNFKIWFDLHKDSDNSYWFTSYWYFREPIYQALQTEGAGLLIKRHHCNWNLNVRNERQQLFSTPNFVNGDNFLVGYDNIPMMHHYSWVRTKEAMLLKVKNWGHKNDKEWSSLVEEEFSRPFNGKDFVHGYNYKSVENIFNI